MSSSYGRILVGGETAEPSGHRPAAEGPWAAPDGETADVSAQSGAEPSADQYIDRVDLTAVGTQRMSIDDQVAALEHLADHAPDEIAHAIGHIVEGLETNGDTAPDDPDTLLVGEFIESRCGTDLPGDTGRRVTRGGEAPAPADARCGRADRHWRSAEEADTKADAGAQP